MFVQNQLIEMKWNSRNKEYYIAKGYQYTKKGQIFYVKLEDLTSGVRTKVKVICDYCGKEIEKSYTACLKQRRSNGKDCCKSCSSKKQSELCFDKYGVDNPSHINSVKAKRKQTFLDRYGVINPSQVPEFHKKKIETCFEHYGTNYPMQSEKIKAQSKKTCLEKYGVEYYFQTDEFKDYVKEYWMNCYGVNNVSKADITKLKIEEVWLEKYGVRNIMELPEFRQKILESFVKNGNAPTSSTQIIVSNMLKDIYGSENVKDNVPYEGCLLDMVLSYQGYKINVEYDGWYWHKYRQEQDKRRNYYLRCRGYKVLRIRSNNELPTKEQIIEGVDYLVKGNHSLKFIDLDINI